MVIKFDFNCILINKDGVHPIDLASTTPLAGLDKPAPAAPAAAASDVPVGA
jgi:20S proteasome subunit beta 4